MASARPLILALAALLLASPSWSAVKGDLNDDGAVDSADAMLLLRIVNGEIDPLTLDPQDVADVAPIVDGVGGDGAFDAVDALVMLRALREDVDTDGLTTPGENAIGTSPFLADTEGDGWDDAQDPDPLAFSPPGVPSTLRVVDGTSDVEISWQAPPGETTHYVVHRFGTDGSYAFEVLDAGATSWTDDDVQASTVYRYWIEAVNSRGQQGLPVDCDVSDPDNQTLWLTGALGTYPNPWFTATAAGSTVTLTWEASPIPEVDEYEIHWSTTPVELGETAGLTYLTSVKSPTLTHDVTSLAPGTYFFRIIAVNSGGGTSNLASAKQVAVAVN